MKLACFGLRELTILLNQVIFFHVKQHTNGFKHEGYISIIRMNFKKNRNCLYLNEKKRTYNKIAHIMAIEHEILSNENE